ncbi:DsbA family protein [uncultured Nitratireductor sp.]|uniref:DsbA family protein n=1 Tax=uncultured Nitratireductor sp. TaxID=520953 RepID=UPI0025D9D1C0|nr:DsbA family protein [uncultured Nitratireductor sp.]
MMNRRILLVAGAATLVTAGAARAQLYPTVEEVLFDPEIPVIGNPKGDVTIAEFFDYQCPYCKRGHPDLLDVVREDGNVRLVMKDWPIFGEPSVHAASLVLAAGPDYEAVHNALMVTPGRLTKDEVDETLSTAGHDPEKLLSNFRKDRQRIEGILSRNMDQANAFGFKGTPAFLFNTKIHYGALDRHAILVAISEARGQPGRQKTL